MSYQTFTERIQLSLPTIYVNFGLSPHTPVAQKVTDEVVFRRFQDEGVKFLNRALLGFISRLYFESDGFIAYSNE